MDAVAVEAVAVEAVAVEAATAGPLAADWRPLRACAGQGGLFLYDSSRERSPLGLAERTAPAKAVCSGCPVQTECLLEALRTPPQHDFDVWGGTDHVERRALRRLLRVQGAPVQTRHSRACRCAPCQEERWQAGVAV